MKKIVTIPHPALRKVSEPVKKVDNEVKNLAKELWNALEHSKVEGVGIAAPQIGVTKRVFILREGLNSYQTYINPQVIWASKEKGASKTSDGNTFLEGCLSIPNLYGPVIRPLQVEVEYTDLRGAVRRKKFDEPFSRYFQHELDHLNGILFTDHIVAQHGKLYFLNEQDELEEIPLESILSVK